MTHGAMVESLVGGRWRAGSGRRLPVVDPALGEPFAEVALCSADEVGEAIGAATRAAAAWRRVPPGERIQHLFRFKGLLEQELEALAQGITRECGKTLAEARAEVRRGIENVEVACGMPALLQGWVSEDIAAGIDELMIRQPLGVVAAVTPFNFPAMIPLWFLPYAVATGNAFVLKPSERVPLTATALGRLAEAAGFPAGVVQVVHGDKQAVDALLDHPDVRALSFVGSTPVARYVYARAAAQGKRAQCQGGAKNPVVVLPDADLEMTTQIITDSAFGCAGQRCLAAATAITVGEASGRFSEALCARAAARRIGSGLDAEVEMGPVISAESRTRIAGLVDQGLAAGARPLVDGRRAAVPAHPRGFFLAPTVLGGVAPDNPLAGTEIFGPVLCLTEVPDLDAAIRLVNDRAYGNMASLFTSSGAAARKFRYEVTAGNVGINLGVAAPMAYFPFSGFKESFFGDLHAQGRDAVDFYTDKKVVIERWPKEWSRRF